MSNVFTSIVRLGKDPEYKTVGQSDLVSFSAAVTTGYGERKGTMWVNCNIWGKQGPAIMPYIKKGNQVMVSGELSSREFEGNGGIKKSYLELKVSVIELIGGKKESTPAPTPAPTPENGDDMPF